MKTLQFTSMSYPYHSKPPANDLSLAVEFVMETTSLSSDTLVVEKPSQIAPQNPYVLPFAMRGLLEEDFVRKELSDETLNLLKQFDDWKPTTKVLRDVKYRLEGIRSKL